MLKKGQGQRGFVDSATLEDYGIGNGCSLDLEVDTTAADGQLEWLVKEGLMLEE